MPEEVGFLFALGPEFDRIGEGVHGLFVAWRLLGEKKLECRGRQGIPRIKEPPK